MLENLGFWKKTRGFLAKTLKNCLFFQKKRKRKQEISWFFKFFKASRALWQKVLKIGHRKRKWGPEMLKNLSFLKKTRGFLAKTLKNCLFFLKNRKRKQEISWFFKFFKASCALWQKVANFCHRKRKWGPKMLKKHVFWKKTRAFSQKVWNLQDFSPPNRKWRLLLHFYVTIFSIFEQNKQNFFF